MYLVKVHEAPFYKSKSIDGLLTDTEVGSLYLLIDVLYLFVSSTLKALDDEIFRNFSSNILPREDDKKVCESYDYQISDDKHIMQLLGALDSTWESPFQCFSMSSSCVCRTC